MINFITSEEAYFTENINLKKNFREGVDFVCNSFNADFNLFIAFEFDKIYSETFYNGLLSFLNYINDEGFTFYTLNPPPDLYFFSYFLKYSIGKIPFGNTYNDYIDFLGQDPGGSPADALLYNAETIAMYSKHPIWGITGSKDLEIGIVGFKNRMTKEKFLTSFDDREYFTDITTRINEIDNMLELTSDSRQIYLQIEKNYVSKV